MDYTVTVILKSATVDIYLDKLYAKHRIMNIHEGKMVNMIHLIQLGIIHRDNVYNRAEPSCQLVKRGKKKKNNSPCTNISELLISPLSGCIPDESSQLSQ